MTLYSAIQFQCSTAENVFITVPVVSGNKIGSYILFSGILYTLHVKLSWTEHIGIIHIQMYEKMFKNVTFTLVHLPR